jgi:hypothetical protein
MCLCLFTCLSDGHWSPNWWSWGIINVMLLMGMEESWKPKVTSEARAWLKNEPFLIGISPALASERTFHRASTSTRVSFLQLHHNTQLWQVCSPIPPNWCSLYPLVLQYLGNTLSIDRSLSQICTIGWPISPSTAHSFRRWERNGKQGISARPTNTDFDI